MEINMYYKLPTYLSTVCTQHTVDMYHNYDVFITYVHVVIVHARVFVCYLIQVTRYFSTLLKHIRHKSKYYDESCLYLIEYCLYQKYSFVIWE